MWHLQAAMGWVHQHIVLASIGGMTITAIVAKIKLVWSAIKAIYGFFRTQLTIAWTFVKFNVLNKDVYVMIRVHETFADDAPVINRQVLVNELTKNPRVHVETQVASNRVDLTIDRVYKFAVSWTAEMDDDEALVATEVYIRNQNYFPVGYRDFQVRMNDIRDVLVQITRALVVSSQNRAPISQSVQVDVRLSAQVSASASATRSTPKPRKEHEATVRHIVVYNNGPTVRISLDEVGHLGNQPIKYLPLLPVAS